MTVIKRFSSRYRETANPLLSERRIELVAVALTVVLLVQVLYSILRLSNLSEPESIAPALDVMIASDPIAIELVSAELSEELRARPLFWPSRRTRENEAVPASAAKKTSARKTELDKVKLVGIFGAGESAGIIALVRGKKQRILVGEAVEGWSLDSVARNEVVFSDGRRRKVLILQPQKYVAASATSDSSGAIPTSGARPKSVAGPGAAPAAAKDKTAKRSLGLGFGGNGNK
jgi:hypothetical protein